MSIADWEIEEPAGLPEHSVDEDTCRCADCVTNRIDDEADMGISK